jgi:flagellar biogenesis protein FliO
VKFTWPALCGLWVTATATSPALAQHLAEADTSDVPWWRVIGAFILCIALAVGAALALRLRYRGVTMSLGSKARKLQIIESVRIAPQVDVCLLRCENRQLLIAATPHGATLLDSADLPPAAADDQT